MLEPVTWGIIAAKLATPELVGSIIGGVLGNRADFFLNKSLIAIKDSLKNNDELKNHDIQRAVREAYLKAGLIVFNSYLKKYNYFDKLFDSELQDIKSALKYLRKELKQVHKADYTIPENPAEEQYELLVAAEETNNLTTIALKENLKKIFLKELSENKLTLKKEVGEMILNGWEEEGNHLDWYSLFCAFFDEILKTNTRVQEKVHRNLLLDIKQQLNIPIDATHFAQALENIALPFAKQIEELKLFLQQIDEKLDIIQEQNETTHAKLDKLENLVEQKFNYAHFLTPIPALETFIGRELELQNLINELDKNNKVVLVNGIGGIGKTTMAKAYVHRKHADFSHIIWISVIGNTIKEAFVNTDYLEEGSLQKAKLTEGDTEERFKAMMNAIHQLPVQKDKKNLLVIDNAEDDILDIKNQLPTTAQWTILLTSRLTIQAFKEVELEKLDANNALLLFKEYYALEVPANEEPILKDLLQEIDYHTLTIELVAKTIKESDNNLKFTEVLEKLKSRNLDDKRLQETIYVAHYDESQAKLYNHLLATFNLTKLSPYEIWLLQQFAVLPPEPWLKNILQDWLKIEEESIEIFEITLKKLKNKGWLKRTKDNDGEALYSIHRLVQDMVHYQYTIVFEDIEKLVDSFIEFSSFDVSTNYALKFAYLKPTQYLLKTLVKLDADEPLSVLYHNLGIVYKQFSDLENALIYSKKTLSYTIKNFEEEDPTVAASQSNLAVVYYDLGRLEEAKELLEKALASSTKAFGEAHASVSISQSNLALVYKDLGRLEEAKDLLEKALASNIKNFGEEHPSVATSQSNLAVVYQALGRLEEAKDLLEKSLVSDIKNFGDEHPFVARCQSNLATVYQDLGRLEEAKGLLKKSLFSDIKNLGDEHPSVAIIQSNLALVYKDLGRLEEAKDLLEKALASNIKNFGEEHPSVVRSQSNLAVVYQALGRLEEAKDLLEKALASNIKNFGEEHASVASSQSNLALVYKDLGRFKKAKDLLEKALVSQKKNLGEDHISVAKSQLNLASVLMELYNFQTDLQLLVKALQLLEKAYITFLLALGDDHQETQNCLGWLNRVKELMADED